MSNNHSHKHNHKKFNPHKLAKLNNPERLINQNPEVMLSKLKNPNKKSVIDIGAGTGVFSVRFLELLADNLPTVCALDISDIMLDYINEHHVPKFNQRLITQKMEESLVPLTHQSVDLALMFNLHHELDEPVKILTDVYRVLQIGGEILISDWKNIQTKDGPPLEIRVSTQQIKADLEKAGFKEVGFSDEFKEHGLVWAIK